MRTIAINGKIYRKMQMVQPYYRRHAEEACRLAGIRPEFFHVDGEIKPGMCPDNLVMVVDMDKGGSDPAAYDLFVATAAELSKAYFKKLENLGFPIRERFKRKPEAPYVGCEMDWWPELSEEYKRNGRIVNTGEEDHE